MTPMLRDQYTENEPVESKFDVLEDGVRCGYCETIVREDIADHLKTE